ncbi:MAG: ketopantoate reductase family protein [Chloroflexi bacterium]|nr:ketopantoate reductase family protein [Chloroflexota bacterium]
MRVAILGMGAIGHVVAAALEDRVDLVKVDRTHSPLRDGEGPVDAAVVCVKTYGTEWAAQVAQRILAPQGVIVTVQNGLGNVETLAAAVGPARVALGVIYVGAEMVDGALKATGAGRVELGRPGHPRGREHLERLGATLQAGGMTVSVVDDPWPAVWRKLVVNAAMNPTTAIFGITNPELLHHPAARPIADDLARETARVATASGVAIDPDAAPGMWHPVTSFVNRSSMLQDMSSGRPTEIDAINGAVVREGARHGVAAPANEAITILVKAVEARAIGVPRPI